MAGISNAAQAPSSLCFPFLPYQPVCLKTTLAVGYDRVTVRDIELGWMDTRELA